MRLDWLADKLRAAGLTVNETAGWQGRGREWPRTPTGVLVHHDATPRSHRSDAQRAENSARILVSGHSTLPGPIGNLYIDRSGTVWVIAGGASNHAGKGKAPWLLSVNDGNSHLIGIEALNDGVGELWPGAQIAAYAKTCAVLLREIGQGAERCIAHKEYARGRKADPAGGWETGGSWGDMRDFRRLVQAALTEPFAGRPAPPASPAPTTPEALMALTAIGSSCQRLANGRQQVYDAHDNQDGTWTVVGQNGAPMSHATGQAFGNNVYAIAKQATEFRGIVPAKDHGGVIACFGQGVTIDIVA